MLILTEGETITNQILRNDLGRLGLTFSKSFDYFGNSLGIHKVLHIGCVGVHV